LTEPVTRLFSEKQPGPEAEDVGPDFVQVARSIAQICATRILLLIAVLTGAGIWAFTIWSPETPRLYAAVAFSIVFVIPQVALFWKRG
jgi:multidrug resistance efflux pump